MVDNRGVSPITTYFKSGDASGMANKMSDEKYGQGGEYFMQTPDEEETTNPIQNWQDKTQQLRASLNCLAAQNAGFVQLMKNSKNKIQKQNKLQDDDYDTDDILEEEYDFQENE